MAAEADIDRAKQLGANHPFGPFEWARRTGVHEVVVMLDALSDEDADVPAEPAPAPRGKGVDLRAPRLIPGTLV